MEEVNKQLCKDITLILYSQGKFIGKDFHDAYMRRLYNELIEKRETYERLFELFNVQLEYDKETGCFHLYRSNWKPDVVRMEKDFQKWTMIINFLFNTLGYVECGKSFSYTTFLTGIERKNSLVDDLSKLVKENKNTDKTDIHSKVDEILNTMCKDQLIEKYDEDGKTMFFITSVINYWMKYIKEVKRMSEDNLKED